MSQAMLLPAAVLVIGLVAALSFARPKHLVRPAGSARRRGVRGVTGRVTASSVTRDRQPIEWPVLRRFSQASTTRAAMPASPALPQARGS